MYGKINNKYETTIKYTHNRDAKVKAIKRNLLGVKTKIYNKILLHPDKKHYSGLLNI